MMETCDSPGLPRRRQRHRPVSGPAQGLRTCDHVHADRTSTDRRGSQSLRKGFVLATMRITTLRAVTAASQSLRKGFVLTTGAAAAGSSTFSLVGSPCTCLLLATGPGSDQVRRTLTLYQQFVGDRPLSGAGAEASTPQVPVGLEVHLPRKVTPSARLSPLSRPPLGGSL